MALETMSFIFLLHPPAPSAAEKGKQTVAHKGFVQPTNSGKELQTPNRNYSIPMGCKELN